MQCFVEFQFDSELKYKKLINFVVDNNTLQRQILAQSEQNQIGTMCPFVFRFSYRCSFGECQMRNPNVLDVLIHLGMPPTFPIWGTL